MSVNARWLFKTEPSDYSYQRLSREGRTTWDGVSNALALKHLRQVRRGDSILIYHAGNEKAVVGIARAVGDAREPGALGFDSQSVPRYEYCKQDIPSGGAEAGEANYWTVAAQKLPNVSLTNREAYPLRPPRRAACGC